MEGTHHPIRDTYDETKIEIFETQMIKFCTIHLKIKFNPDTVLSEINSTNVWVRVYSPSLGRRFFDGFYKANTCKYRHMAR